MGVCREWRVVCREWLVGYRGFQTGVLKACPCLEAGTGARDWWMESLPGRREMELGPGLRVRGFDL